MTEPEAKRAKLETDDGAAGYLAKHEITIHEEGAPPPCLTLATAPFPAPLVKLLSSQGFSSPSPVQAATWPIAVSGRDVLAIAKTGSGKTLGFLLPVLKRRQPSVRPTHVAPIWLPFGLDDLIRALSPVIDVTSKSLSRKGLLSLL